MRLSAEGGYTLSVIAKTWVLFAINRVSKKFKKPLFPFTQSGIEKEKLKRGRKSCPFFGELYNRTGCTHKNKVKVGTW